MKPKKLKQLSVGLFLGLAFVSQGKELWTEGHGDIGAHYVSGIWNWTILHGGSPDDYIVALDNDGKLQVPDLPSFEFLGAPGDNIWIISQSETVGVPFVGMASDTVGGMFENNRFAITLESFEGPGEFSMWTTSGAGQVSLLMSSADGLDEQDFINMPAPGHLHQNWGFSSPGTYQLGFQASGTLQSNSETTTSEVQKFEFAVNVLRDGEVDIEVLYENGEWELALLIEATETEFEPDEAALHASPLTWTAVPADAAFGFLGAVDSDLYVLPQEEQEGVLYLGIAGDEIATGVFESDAVSLELVSVEGPGNVFLYSTDAFGAPEVFFNSADGIDEMDVFPVAVGGHAHQNWAFSAPGVYHVTVQASGTLVGGAETSSEPARFMFEVFGPTIFEQGELDLEVAYEEGELEVVALDEATETELELSDVVVRGLPESMAMIPEGAAYEFLGTAGESIYILPQEEVEGLIYLGIAGDEIPADVFTDNNVTLSLMGVSGPGDTFLYSVDAFGEPTVYFNSADGVDASDVYPVAVGGHAHQNWAFSEAGAYEVQLQASGALASDSSEIMSEVVTLRFHIVAPAETSLISLREGEVDLEVLYENGEWELALLSEATEMEFEPGEAALYASPLTWNAVPADAAFGFLGAVDSDLYVLPQEEQEGVLYLGIAGDEIATGVFESDAVSLELVSVEGPGNVFLYSTDAFGAPEVFFNSADGIDEMDVFPVAVGGHAHQNWAFSAPGVYHVTVQASGTLVGGAETTSEPATFMFEVFGPTIFEQGELDLEVAYEEGELEVVALDEATETELELSDVVVRGLPESMAMIPEGAAYEFLGTAGESIYILPQEEVEGLIYLGIAGDEIPADMFTENNVALSLIGVSGPGDTFLYSVDAFGEPTVYFNSADGVDASDVYPVAVGGHAHQNWAFSEAGVYEVQLQASGALAADSSDVMSEVVTLRFHIVAPQTGTELMITHMDESTVQVSWLSMSGSNYQLQSSSDPAATEWEPVGDPIPGTGEIISVDYSIEEVIAEFLRVQID